MIIDYLELGKIVGVHALKGEVRLQPWCDSAEFIKQFKTVYFDNKGSKSVKLVSCRPHGNVAILKLDGCDTPEQAQALRNKVLYMKRADANLPDGFYFIRELLGCKVFDADNGKYYGEISDISVTGANDVWHIKNEREFLIPAIPPVIESVDVESGIIKIHPLRGIFDEEVNGDE